MLFNFQWKKLQPEAHLAIVLKVFTLQISENNATFWNATTHVCTKSSGNAHVTRKSCTIFRPSEKKNVRSFWYGTFLAPMLYKRHIDPPPYLPNQLTWGDIVVIKTNLFFCWTHQNFRYFSLMDFLLLFWFLSTHFS